MSLRCRGCGRDVPDRYGQWVVGRHGVRKFRCNPCAGACACGRPAIYYQTINGFLQRICHTCWRQQWRDELVQGGVRSA